MANPAVKSRVGAIVMYLFIVQMIPQNGFANERPVAVAGVSRYVATETVKLDGSNSYDPDGTEPLGYKWTQVSGPSVEISECQCGDPYSW